jgi:hypothetical protein
MFDEKTRHQLASFSKIKRGTSNEEIIKIRNEGNAELDRFIEDLKKRQPEKFLNENDLKNRVFFDQPNYVIPLKYFVRPYKGTRQW